jgi:DNA-binding YbaB/EbfC family protein
MFRNLPKMREEMQKMQERLGSIVVEGDAGGGMVKVKANGKMELLSCVLTEDALKDRELLEDMIRAAVNQAMQQARQQVAEETAKATGGLGLPGMG